jgi:hypothetical protein
MGRANHPSPVVYLAEHSCAPIDAAPIKPMLPSERCLMIAFASTLLAEDGYTVRVMMATRAVVDVQAGSAPAPVDLGFESLRSLVRRAAVRAAKRRITG